MKISGQTILITGAGSGIGKALAKKLYELKNTLIVVGRSKEKLDNLKKKLPNITCFSYDLSVQSEINQLIETIRKAHANLSVIFNNAGCMEVEDFKNEEYNESSMIHQTETNFYAPVRLIHGLMPLLLKQPQPAIINVSTVLVYVPFAATPAYCASKAALSSYTQSLRIQYERSSLRVFEILPPLVQTDMASTLGKSGMGVDKFAKQVIQGFKKDQYIIRPGQAKALYFMYKHFRKFLQKQMNKSAFEVLNKYPEFANQ